MRQIPNLPTTEDNVTLKAEIVDNRQISSVTAYYSINNGTEQSISLTSDGSSHGYTAKLSRYLLEDHIRYRISASDGTNIQNSSTRDYTLSEPHGVPNASFSYLNSPVYYFGYSRAGTTYDQGGDTNYDGTWTTGELDGAYYMQANPQVYAFFRNMTTIKMKTLILDSKGKPVTGLTNVTAWLQANKTQAANEKNAIKTMNESPDEVGVYTATWSGSPAMSGTAVTWNNDAVAIWGKYDSGQMYSVYVDFNNDSVADENVTWLAYAFGDTYWGATEDGRTFVQHGFENTNGCGRACHQGMVGSTSRVDAEPTCADCHGVEKTANGGVWPISGATAATDTMLYGNSSSHPRLNNSGNKTYCGDASCHNYPWRSSTPPDPAQIPGYPSGVAIDTIFNNSGFPNPAQCGECHTLENGTIPAINGHNEMVKCKFCHGDQHRQHNLTDYNITTVKDDVSRGTPGYVGAGGQIGGSGYAGNCSKDCHKVQVEHSLTGKQGGSSSNQIVPCDECHQNFNKAPMHQDNVKPYSDRDTCGGCHQAVGAITTHNASLSMNPPRIPSPLLHSQQIGDKWNKTGTRVYWAEEENSCKYCHGRSYNEEYGLGRVRNFMGTNILNGTVNSTSYWCASCHVQTYSSGSSKYDDMVAVYNTSFGVVPPEISGNATWKSDQSGYTDHQAQNYINKSDNSTFPDSKCFSCHKGTLASGTNSTLFLHDVSTGAAGGPNCTACHNVGQSPPSPGGLVNFSAMNDSSAVHRNLNKNATASDANYSESKKCWACHGNGTEPTDHPSRQKTPYNCTDCHVPDAGRNLNYTPNNTILNVTQHYWNGTNITTSAVISCYACHNKSEMMLGSVDPDGAASVYGGVNGGNNSSSHYGKKRSDLRTWDSGRAANCSNCHQNSTTAFVSAMLNAAYNSSIQNHSTGSSPTCYNSTCHNSGFIHNSTLTRPTLPLPNTTYCQTCHAGKQEHNGT